MSVGQIRLNVWQGDFFNALEQHNLAIFGSQLLVFSVIVGVLLVLVVAQTWLKEILQVRLREWLTHDLLDRWLAPKRAYLLAHAGEIGVNPDQRVHEDTRHLIDLSTDLAVRMLQASLLLISFIGVLWVLSAKVVFVAGDRSFTIPGYMVWCALVYAIGGSWLAWRVGRPLIPLNATRYAREADLRFSLVRVSECAEGIALYGGETDERRILEGTVDHVLTVMRRLAGGLARLTWVTSGYGWLAIVAPVLVAAPGYFGGSLSFGGLMMVIGAFNQVQQSLRWFVDDFHRIADWRATLLRVMALREALAAADTVDDDRERIELVDHAAGHIGLENLTVAARRWPGHARRRHGRDRPGRARPDRRRDRFGQEHPVPGDGGTVAVGYRHHPPAAAAQHDVHAAATLPAARQSARRGQLSGRARPLRRSGGGRCADAGRPRPSRAHARSASNGGTGICRWKSSNAWPLPACCCISRAGC